MEPEHPTPIPFNRPFIVGKELHNISLAVLSGHLAGNGIFTKQCQTFLEKETGCAKVLMTSSCTGALEMAAMLTGLQPGEEVVLPAYTFVSTANAFYMRGAKLIFADIRPDTLNLDPASVAERIGPKTKAVCVVHYAGVGCEMDEFLALRKKHGFILVEDAAHAVCAYYKDKPLGSFGDLSTFSFHETKNFISGEGGALGINDPGLIERAEILWEKGTNRSKFLRGQADKYTWVDIGSSYLPSELITAFLYAQFEEAETITRHRLASWSRYREGLFSLEVRGDLRLPVIPAHSRHNAHMFYVLLPDGKTRDALMARLQAAGILAVFHYVPLHTSPMGLSMGYRAGMLPVTESISDRVLRLPLFYDLKGEDQNRIVREVRSFFGLN